MNEQPYVRWTVEVDLESFLDCSFDVNIACNQEETSMSTVAVTLRKDPKRLTFILEIQVWRVQLVGAQNFDHKGYLFTNLGIVYWNGQLK